MTNHEDLFTKALRKFFPARTTIIVRTVHSHETYIATINGIEFTAVVDNEDEWFGFANFQGEVVFAIPAINLWA